MLLIHLQTFFLNYQSIISDSISKGSLKITNYQDASNIVNSDLSKDNIRHLIIDRYAEVLKNSDISKIDIDQFYVFFKDVSACSVDFEIFKTLIEIYVKFPKESLAQASFSNFTNFLHTLKGYCGKNISSKDNKIVNQVVQNTLVVLKNLQSSNEHPRNIDYLVSSLIHLDIKTGEIWKIIRSLVENSDLSNFTLFQLKEILSSFVQIFGPTEDILNLKKRALISKLYDSMTGEVIPIKMLPILYDHALLEFFEAEIVAYIGDVLKGSNITNETKIF